MQDSRLDLCRIRGKKHAQRNRENYAYAAHMRPEHPFFCGEQAYHDAYIAAYLAEWTLLAGSRPFDALIKGHHTIQMALA